MQQIIISLISMLLLFITGCQDERFIADDNNVPEGFVKVIADRSSLVFGKQEMMTRAGETDQERIIRNGKFFVFEEGATGLENSSKLIEVRNVNTNTGSAVLMERDNNVTIVCYMNLPDDSWSDFDAATGLTNATGIPSKEYTWQDFQTSIEKQIVYSPSNKMLKNTDSGFLPLVGYLHHTKIQPATGGIALNVMLKFLYARIDLTLGTSSTETLEEIMVVNPASVPGATSDKFINNTTHTVISSGGSKTIQGFYTYSTNPTISPNIKGSELVFKVKRGTAYRYYKLLLRYKEPANADFSYDLREGVKYTISIKSLDSEGYASLQEAINLPPANIDYDILIDDSSAVFITNGQYYIGFEQEKYQVNPVYKSHMLYSESSGVLPTTGTAKQFVDVVLTIGTSVDSNIDISNILTKEIILPAGVEVVETDLPEGFSTKANLFDTFGTKKLRLSMPNDLVSESISIAFGELTFQILLECADRFFNITDYTDAQFVNYLTGLADGDGGITGLRVANCYICPPLTVSDAIYYIPVDNRINEFWSNNYAGNISGRIDEEDWTIVSSDFAIETSWYDGTSINGLKIEKAISPSNLNAIKVVIPAHFEHQNVVVNVKKNNIVIWSWHLWITDYNPYVTNTLINGIYQYPVVNKTLQVELTQNGELHRYQDGRDGNGVNGSMNIWSASGLYKDKFIMDRYIGATAATYAGHGLSLNNNSIGKGALFYQYGRKDPFPGGAGKHANGSVYEPLKKAGAVDFIYVINNPKEYITEGSNWNSNTSSSPADTWYWNDRSITNVASTKNKSIFDPCPLGWRIPFNGTISNFNATTFTVVDRGRQYTAVNAIFPVLGSRLNSSGNLYASAANGYYWSVSPSNGSSAYYLRFYSNSAYAVEPSVPNSRSHAFPIRPVQE